MSRKFESTSWYNKSTFGKTKIFCVQFCVLPIWSFSSVCPHVTSQTALGFQLFPTDLAGKLRLPMQLDVLVESARMSPEIAVGALSLQVVGVNLCKVVPHIRLGHACVVTAWVVTFLQLLLVNSDVVSVQVVLPSVFLWTFVTVHIHRCSIWEFCLPHGLQFFSQVIQFVYSQVSSHTSFIITS